jgi:hypothetical protein
MKTTLRKIALFTMLISFQAFGEAASGTATPDDTLTEQDIELMQRNPDLAFVVLTDDVRQVILQSAQADQDMQINSACIEASQLIEQGFRAIPHELAMDIVAEMELKEAEQAANDRGCKTKCYSNLCVKNILSAQKLRVCDGGIISGGLVVNAASSTNCCSTRSTICTNGPCVNGCGLVVNGESVFNGLVTMNCGEDVIGGLTVDDATVTGNLTVDGCVYASCFNITGATGTTGGCITTPCLNVSGTATINNLLANNETVTTLHVTGNETINGNLVVGG